MNKKVDLSNEQLFKKKSNISLEILQNNLNIYISEQYRCLDNSQCINKNNTRSQTKCADGTENTWNQTCSSRQEVRLKYEVSFVLVRAVPRSNNR